MSICSDAPSEASLMASSPDEGWPADSVSNLNRTASTTTLNNNSTTDDPNSNSNNSRQRQENFLDSSIIIHPGSTAATAVHQNQNLSTLSLHRLNLKLHASCSTPGKLKMCTDRIHFVR
uniref:Uncharacterized protein n=1 Tax=Poecilia mexicana TaxID=48701 RepID=A0A3B3WV01_9TELE